MCVLLSTSISAFICTAKNRGRIGVEISFRRNSEYEKFHFQQENEPWEAESDIGIVHIASWFLPGHPKRINFMP